MSDSHKLVDLRLMRRQEVQQVCGISRSLLYSMVAERRFPQPFRINERAVGWREADVREWLASRPTASHTEWR